MALEIPAIKYQPEDEVQFFAVNPELKGLWLLLNEGISVSGQSQPGMPQFAPESFLPTEEEALAIILVANRFGGGTFKKLGEAKWLYWQKGQSLPVLLMVVALPILLAADY